MKIYLTLKHSTIGSICILCENNLTENLHMHKKSICISLRPRGDTRGNVSRNMISKLLARIKEIDFCDGT